MTNAERERRILILAPTGKDATLTQSILRRAGVDSMTCRDLDQLRDAIQEGVGAVLLAEEAVQGSADRLARLLAAQPPWSDLPLLVLARAGADSAAVARAMDQLGNVTVLERPIRVAALVSVVRTALRARLRQYQGREHLELRARTEAALREADRRKDEFLAVLAHELRNPLAPIRHGLHALRLAAHQDERTLHVREIMERQVNHMVRLVDDLLEVSRITRGTIELREELVEVGTIVRGAVETSRPLIEAARHELAVTVPQQSLVVRGDPVRLTQLVANLLNNAAKYTDAGGHIWLDVEGEPGWVTIAVRDDGTGIPPELLPRVFDIFTQVGSDMSRSQGGMGIGLALVKSLVEMHGGSVKAESEGPGEGSRFVVRLPRSSHRMPVGAEGRRREQEAPLRGKRLLVVDDNRDAAESLAGLLGLLGADVQVVFSGEEALPAMRAHRPLAVLLDIGMPGMNGHEVARSIRTDPAFKDVMLIALTGWGQESDRLQSQAAGFDHHLIKPADMMVLQSLLEPLDDAPGQKNGIRNVRP